MKKEVYNKLKEKVENLEKLINGGKGSGNFGHSGRPGEVGGSGGGYAGIGSSKADKIEKMIDRKVEARRKIAETEALHGIGEMSGEKAAEKIADLKAEEKLEKLEKTRIHKKYLDQGLSNIQEKTVAEQEKKIEALRKIKIEYKDTISKVGKEELVVMSRLDKQEKDALEYLEKLKKIESSKKKTNGVKMKKELYNELKKRIDALETMLNGGKGSGNWGHAGRPGEVGGSSSGGLSGISKAIAGSKKNVDQAKIVQEDIEDRIGQKVKKGEEYTALDEASTSRFKYFHGEDGTEYTYDKSNGTITKTNPKTGDQEVVTKQKDKGFQSEYKVGDSYTKGGVTYDVVDGENGPMAVSKDGKINTELPDKLRYEQTKMIRDTFDGMRDEGVPMSSPRYDAARDTYKRIQERAIETSQKGLDASKAPRMVHEAVEKFLTEIKSPSSSPRVAGRYEEAKGLIRWWSMGNGGMKKPQSSQIRGEIKELKAELDSLYERYRIMTTPKGFRK